MHLHSNPNNPTLEKEKKGNEINKTIFHKKIIKIKAYRLLQEKQRDGSFCCDGLDESGLTEGVKEAACWTGLEDNELFAEFKSVVVVAVGIAIGSVVCCVVGTCGTEIGIGEGACCCACTWTCGCCFCSLCCLSL